MKIAHLSDIHFGKIAHPEIVGVLIQELNDLGVDLVAVSGDLTQRARTVEYEAAAAMLNAFDAPTLVVPGNHDVYAWWYPVGRLFHPLTRYSRYITKNLTPTFECEGLAVLGINSAHGRTVKGGRIGSAEREMVQSYFSEAPADAFKVLVVHHHLTQIQALGPHDVAHKARKTLEAASEAGVDLILCGHLHISHIEPVEVVSTRRPVVIVSAGTATSNRGRRTNRNTNFYNVITVDPDHFLIEERRFDEEMMGFATDRETRFVRGNVEH